jgi:hypothetical protein
MTLASAFQGLSGNLQALREEFILLRWTVVEDTPLPKDHEPIKMFGEATDALLGWLEDCLTAASAGQQAVEREINLDRACRALTTCQKHFNDLQWSSDPDPNRFFRLVYECIAPLLRAGRKRGQKGDIWVNRVNEALYQCHYLLYDVDQALLQCWEEVAERAGMTSVSVRATNIGQQIAVPEGWDAKQEEFT